MKKALGVVFLVLIVALIIGCMTKVEKDGDQSVDEKEIDDGLSEIDSIDEDLNLSELDEIDSMLDELEEI